MQRCFTLAIVIATCADATVFGQNVLRLYPEKKLQADAARWSEQIQAEYRETILPQLTDEERSALGTVKIEVPLQGQMEIRSHSTPTTRARFTCRRFRYDSFRISAWRTPGSMLTDTTALLCAITSVCSYARRHSRRALRSPRFFAHSAFPITLAKKAPSPIARIETLETRSSFCSRTS